MGWPVIISGKWDLPGVIIILPARVPAELNYQNFT